MRRVVLILRKLRTTTSLIIMQCPFMVLVLLKSAVVLANTCVRAAFHTEAVGNYANVDESEFLIEVASIDV